MGSIRFNVAPNEGIFHELEAIGHILKYPTGRRQHEIRRLLGIGVSEIKQGKPSYNRLELSGLDSKTSRFEIYLSEDVPEDQSILLALKDIPADFKPLWLLTALVMGMLADRRSRDIRDPDGGASPASTLDRRDLQSGENSAPRSQSSASTLPEQRRPGTDGAAGQESTEGIAIPCPPSHQQPCHDTDRVDAQAAEGVMAKRSTPKLPMLKGLFS